MSQRKIPPLSPQEAILEQYCRLSAADERTARRFFQRLNPEEQSALQRGAHYDGDAWRHLQEPDTSDLLLWDTEGEGMEAGTYSASMLGYFNILAGRARRYSHPTAHQHEFVELYYVVRGLCSDTIHRHCLTLVPGDLVLLQPGTVHNLDVPGNCLIYHACVRERTFRQLCRQLLEECEEAPAFQAELEQERDTFLLFRTGVDPQLLSLMEQMVAECTHPHKYFNVMLQGQLASLLALLLNEQETESLSASPAERSALTQEHLRSYLRAHLKEATLQSAAAYFGFSDTYFCTLVHRKTGLHFSVLLRQEKLSAAERLLRETNHPIRSICEETGYESISQFSGTFKRHYGAAPGEYRRLNTT